MTTTAIRKTFDRPEPFPLLDFIWTPRFVERTSVVEKELGFYIDLIGGGIGVTSRCITKPAFFIFVMTERGDMRMEVSKKVFDLLQVGDPIIVSYRQGRWTKGALQGKIAR